MRVADLPLARRRSGRFSRADFHSGKRAANKLLYASSVRMNLEIILHTDTRQNRDRGERVKYRFGIFDEIAVDETISGEIESDLAPLRLEFRSIAQRANPDATNLNGLKTHRCYREFVGAAAAGCFRKPSYRRSFVFPALIHRNRAVISDHVASVNDTAQITLIETRTLVDTRRKSIVDV